jgi:hypothetical protein
MLAIETFVILQINVDSIIGPTQFIGLLLFSFFFFVFLTKNFVKSQKKGLNFVI